MEIKQDDPSSPQVAELLSEHLHSMTLHSPPESIHALDHEELKRPEITFWTIWDDDELLGCGALKQLSAHHGEIKSMRTADDHLRKGVASKMLKHILGESKQRGYERLSLETGSMDAYKPARTLYINHGFTYCDPFADYTLDPNSIFMTKEL